MVYKQITMQATRIQSIDALRGIAILGMVLSGSIAFGDCLPAFMYHAQVPPPLHQFNPNLPGITWVDLVFPFFIFAMGAAIPLALQKITNKPKPLQVVLVIAIKRFIMLAFFALFLNHLKAWVINDNPTAVHHLLSLLAFGLLCIIFSPARNKQHKEAKYFGRANAFTSKLIKIVALAVALGLLYYLPFWSGKGFNFYKSDIIIVVLANMALFGTVIYYLTRNHVGLLIGVLPILMAVFLSAKQPSPSWVKTVYEWDSIFGLKIDWLYQFYFLKYLFILLPATVVGNWLVGVSSSKVDTLIISAQKKIIVAAATGILIVTMCGLYQRMVLATAIYVVLTCILLYITVRHLPSTNLYRRLAQLATYLLILGLCIEPYEGGIKKDSSTYSYYFITSGLAVCTLLICTLLASNKYARKPLHYLQQIGTNPMVAYVAGSLVLLPLLSLTGLKYYWDSMHQNWVMGLLKGVTFTAAVALITLLFVRFKWYWKT